MAKSCTVLIGAADLLPTLKQRIGTTGGELLAFTDAETLRALDVVTKRRPRLVALERLFAATPRGTALINRLKADPALRDSEIRVVSHDSDYSRVLHRKGEAAPAVPEPTPPKQRLDWHGTRRAERFKIAGQVDVLVDGKPATLVDLSTIGAQVVSATILKPNQRVRIALAHDGVTIRFNAAIAWAAFEIPPKSAPRYRAGIEFVDADANAVAAFCARHKS